MFYTHQHSIGVVPEAPEDPEPHRSTEELGLDHLGLGELGELSVPGLDVHTASSTVGQTEKVKRLAPSSKYKGIQNFDLHQKPNTSLLYEIQNKSSTTPQNPPFS